MFWKGFGRGPIRIPIRVSMSDLEGVGFGVQLVSFCKGSS